MNNYQEMIRQLLEYNRDNPLLTTWEVQFITNMSKYENFSDKQITKIEELWNRYTVGYPEP